MSSKTTTAFLKELKDGDLKGTVDQVLATCAVIARAKDVRSDGDFRDLRDQSPYTEKVWSKLLQVGMDDRLEGVKEHLPPSYTTLHKIHCLTNDELKKGVQDGHIHPKVSQGSLDRWLKFERFQKDEEASPEDFSSLVTVLGPSGIEEETLNRFKGDLEKLVGIYGFRTQYEGGQTMVALRQQRSQDNAGVLAQTLNKELKSTWDAAAEELKTQFSLTSLDDLIQAPMTTFTGFLNRHRKGRDEFWTFHAHDYIHKIALEYLRASSRAQRFNYRRRLKEVAETHEHLASKVQETLDGVMNY